MAEPDPVTSQLNSLLRVPVCGTRVGQPDRGPAFFGAGAGPGRTRGGAGRRKGSLKAGSPVTEFSTQVLKGKGLGFVDALTVAWLVRVVFLWSGSPTRG